MIQNLQNLGNISSLNRTFGKPGLSSYLRNLVNLYGGVYWPLQETSGSYAYATNTTLALGRDVIINSGFDSDTTWSKGTGWTISGGLASCDGTQTPSTSNLQQAHGGAV